MVSKLIIDGVQGGLSLLGYQLTRAAKDPTYVPSPPNTYPTYSPSEEASFRSLHERFNHRTLCARDRAYILQQVAKQAMHVPGDFAEAGVFRGGTSWFLAHLLREAGDSRTLHALDSFEGMPADTEKARDGHDPGDFGDTSLESVQEFLSEFENITFHPGFIPGTLAPLEDLSFALVHVDVDIHDAVRDCCAFFYPRLAPGGVMLFDDYGFEVYKNAARKAADDYFADKPESLVVLRTGQAMVTKLPPSTA
ncbi:MAG: class I SAM-dependent methyltransferase [Deltaproteobacteria bacterium]|nr:class I SAM-dependent methyltransferase [Deltaproteobacteria bacterium]